MRKILSFDGGGIFGIIPLQVLAEAEKTVGANWSERFDLITGNSVGSIAASFLANGFSAQDALDLFINDAENIFDCPFWHRVKTLNRLRGPKYSSKKSERIFKERLGTPLGDAKTKLMIVSYDLQNFEPYFFKSWRERNLQTSNHEAILASIAAPTYFAPRKFKDTKKERNLIDGGITANNPAMCAYAEARRLWPDEPLSLASFGTGQTQASFSTKETKKWGLLNWATKVSLMFIDGGIDAVDYQLRYVNEVDTNLDYLRVDTKLDSGFGRMDNASSSNINALKTRGLQVFEESRDQILASLT